MNNIQTDIIHKCVLCGASCNDYLSPELANPSDIYAFNYVECPACHIAFLSPMPQGEQLAAHYKSTPRAEGHDNPESYKISPARKRALAATGLSKNGTKILDYGCGKGETVYCLMKDGWDITGVEPFFSPSYDLPELNNRIISKTISNAGFPDESFDLITMWSVLEHITDPATLLNEISRILKKGGTLLIYVPSYNTKQHIRFGKHWPGFGAPEHVTALSEKGLSHFLAPRGFTLKKTLHDLRTSRWMYKNSAYRFMAEKTSGNCGSAKRPCPFTKFSTGLSAFTTTAKESIAGKSSYVSLIYKKEV